MSRQSITQPRNLTLTEELEKLEQSITLTLQGKDFSPQIPRAILIIFVQKSTTISAALIALLLLASSQLSSSTQNIPKRSGKAPRLAHYQNARVLNILASNPAIHSSGNSFSKPVPMFLYQATKRLLRMNLPLTKTHKRLKLTIAS